MKLPSFGVERYRMKLLRFLRKTPKNDAKKVRVKKTWPFIIQDFATALTYVQLLLALLAMVLAIGGVVLYKNLNADAINKQPVQTTGRINLSVRTKAQLTNLVLTSPQIKFIMVTEVNIPLNQRISSWWYLEDPAESKIRLQEVPLLPLPLFNTDAKNTQQLIRVLDNQFSCTPFTETIYYQRFSLVTGMPTLCQLAIPLPRFGLFAGILIFGLDAVPTPEEQEALKLEALRIAAEIFLRGEINTK